jgi:transposase
MLPLVAPGATLIADRAYDTDAIRTAVAERGAWANIAPRSIRKDGLAFSAWVCKQRNPVERFFTRINHFRGLATHDDRSPENFVAALKLAAIRIWLAVK